MPIYEYRCTSCGHQQEFLQKLSDPPRTCCPQCSQETLAKMVTAAGFQLKGSGWYATDFKGTKKSAPAEAKAEGKADAKPEAKSSSKSDGASTAAAPTTSNTSG